MTAKKETVFIFKFSHYAEVVALCICANGLGHLLLGSSVEQLLRHFALIVVLCKVYSCLAEKSNCLGENMGNNARDATL